MREQHHDDTTGQGGPSSADRTSAEGDAELAWALADSARDMHRQEDPAETLQAVVAAAVRLVPGADEGSISAVTGRSRVHSEAASSELAATIDDLQNQTGQGPCLDAAFEQQAVRVTDLSSEQRWPEFSRRAHTAGAASLLALQLFVDGDNLGALNLYARKPDAFDDESEHIGLLFAAHAAMAYAAARRESSLQRAVSTRELIGQAQGILMERHKISSDDAFAMLVAASQHANIKLRDVADRLVHTGEITSL